MISGIKKVFGSECFKKAMIGMLFVSANLTKNDYLQLNSIFREMDSKEALKKVA